MIIKIKKEKLPSIFGILFISLTVLVIAVFAFTLRNELLPGWHEENGERYYISFPLKRCSGIKRINGTDYLFADYGEHALLHGWHKIDDFYYYADDEGKIAKGEFSAGDTKYRADEASGKVYRGAYVLNGKLRYFDDFGFPVAGIVEIDHEKYLFSAAGNLLKGLQKFEGKTYYFDTVGEQMCYGLQTVNGHNYFFGEDGAAVTDTEIEINGIPYTFGHDGRQII